MQPTLSIGPLVLPTAGLVYIIGAWIVLTVIERAAKSLSLDAEATYGVGVATLLGGLVGARLVFVLTHWTAYQSNLVGIIWPLNSGYNLWGGLFFGLAAGFFYGRSRQVSWPGTLDALAPGFVVALFMISLADFLAGPGYGITSDVPWAVNLFGIRRHPVQLYEMLVALAALLAWWRTLSRRSFPGQLFLVVTAVYSAGRLLVDAFRANAWVMGNGYHLVQIASLAVLLASVYLLGRGLTPAGDDKVTGNETQGH